MPGTLGLERAQSAFNPSLVRSWRAASIDGVLVPSFAQGGANIALVLTKS
jgi:hypothetical protein